MSYKIEYVEKALDALGKLPQKDQKRIFNRIDRLAENPRPRRAYKLAGKWSGHYRIRIGNYRIVYTVQDDILLIIVVKIAPRRDVYRI